MQPTEEHNNKIARMTLASVYPHYLNKVLKKNRTEIELLEVIEWLTGFSKVEIQSYIDNKLTFEQLFKIAKLNPKAQLITGKICGYQIETLENELTKKVRYLDKLVDELAKDKSLEKILRK